MCLWFWSSLNTLVALFLPLSTHPLLLAWVWIIWLKCCRWALQHLALWKVRSVSPMKCVSTLATCLLVNHSTNKPGWTVHLVCKPVSFNRKSNCMVLGVPVHHSAVYLSYLNISVHTPVLCIRTSPSTLKTLGLAETGIMLSFLISRALSFMYPASLQGQSIIL